jgi:hypothetical protein
VRAPDLHRVIDFKSGGVLDQETQLPRESYVRQLQLYAYLEFEDSGDWPTRADLLPLSGGTVGVDVDPAVCLALADAAIAALDEYNGTAPGDQPASPAPQHCAMCPYAAVCPAFWERSDESWAAFVLAIRGHVLEAFSTPLGGVTVRIRSGSGSTPADESVIRNIDIGTFPAAASLGRGDCVGAVGLIAEDGPDSYRLPRWGLLEVDGPDAGLEALDA